MNRMINLMVIGLSLGCGHGFAHGSGDCEPQWSDEFPTAWIDQWVREIKVLDIDDVPGPEVYVGGALYRAGGFYSRGIARWDGQTWSPLDEGIPSESLAVLVYAIEAFASSPREKPDLYAGGILGLGDKNLHRWNGREWAVVPGLAGTVRDLLAHDDGRGPALFVAGQIGPVGAITGITRWDGRQWSDVGGGMDAIVRALLAFDDGTGTKLYAAGNFDTAGVAPAVGVASWDGISWSAVGALADAMIPALTIHDDGNGPALIAAGQVSLHPGDPMTQRVIRWTGADWEPVGAAFNDFMRTVTSWDDGRGGPAQLYVGGTFTEVGGVAVKHLARWDGQSWMPIDLDLDDTVSALAPVEDPQSGASTLWIGGDFFAQPPMESDFLTVWDGERTVPLGNGVSSPQFTSGTSYDSGPTIVELLTVEAPSPLEPGLYATGDFANAGSTVVNSVARWDGRNWSALGEGLNNDGKALALFDDGTGEGPALFVGGAFNDEGSGQSDPLARWNGEQWSIPSGPMQGVTWALTRLQNDRIAAKPLLMLGGGLEVSATGQDLDIVGWDGTNWFPIGEGANGLVFALHVFDDGLGDGPVLFAGGSFTTVGGIPANHIARWNGKQWSALAGGVDRTVRAISSFDGGDGAELYVGGQFDTADGILTGSIARWNGEDWSAVIAEGQPIPSYGVPNGYVGSLHVHDDGRGAALFVGGTFTTAAGVPARHVARWDGHEWTGLAAGISLPDQWTSYGYVDALASFDDDADGAASLFVGGQFSLAGGKSSGAIAKWSSCGPGPSAADLNGDGIVGPLDLAILLSAWGSCSGGACPADLSGDYDVDGFDLARLLSQWGE